MTAEIIAKNQLEMEKFGATLGKSLAGGEKLGLVGPLGAGKTTLTKAILKGLGIKGGFSPTFILDAVYQAKIGEIHHLDLYRLKNKDELITLGLQDLLTDDKVVLIVEWADQFPALPTNDSLEITIKINQDDSRTISLKANGDKHAKLLENITRSFN